MDIPDFDVKPDRVADLRNVPPEDSRSFSAVLAVRRVAEKTARNGSPFLAIELGDRTGSFNVVCFSDTEQFDFFRSLPPDSVVRVKGNTAYYQERFSPRLHDVRQLSEREILDNNLLPDLIEGPPENTKDLWDELSAGIAAIEHPQLRATVENALGEHEEAFRQTPAAVAMHHAYSGGLLEHTVHMVRVARAVLPLYTEADPDLVLAGVILHDIGKVEEYEGRLSPRRSRTGILQGHVVLGYRIARRAAIQAQLNDDLRERLEHIILSHQGEMEWGAAAPAATPEAVLVSMIDNLDAKMGMVQRALRVTPENDDFSEYLPGLSASLLVEPPDRSENDG